MQAPSPFIVVSLLLLLLNPFLSSLTRAAFVMCSWKPAPGSPQLLNYTLFCTAGLTDNTTESAYYRCPHNLAFKDNELVAEWGLLALEVFDWGELLACAHSCFANEILSGNSGTPCGDRGYGRDADNDCLGRFWALCLGDSTKGDCFYMASQDGCA